MRKEIYIEDFGECSDRPRRGRDERHGFGEGFHHHDKGRGFHIYGGRRDGHGPHLDEGCNTEHRDHPHVKVFKNKKFYNEIFKTKMFSSKKELVEFVNEVGETGQRVDIFKIEDDLYKVVVYKNLNAKEEVQVEVEKKYTVQE